MHQDGGDCVKNLKRGCNRTEGNTKILKRKEEASWVKEWVPEKGWGWNPFTNYVNKSVIYCYLCANCEFERNRVIETVENSYVFVTKSVFTGLVTKLAQFALFLNIFCSLTFQQLQA